MAAPIPLADPVTKATLPERGLLDFAVCGSVMIEIPFEL
jgi:hypothetical protein